MKEMKRYILGLLMFVAGMMAVSCSDDMNEQSIGDTRTVQTRLAGYLVDGNDATLSAENEVSDVKACLFKDGVLTKVYDIQVGDDGPNDFKVDSNNGNLYVAVNTENLLDWSMIEAGHTMESEWMEQVVAMNGENMPMFFSGKMILENQPTNVPVMMTLKRGLARLDIAMELDDIQVTSLTLKNVAEKGYLNAQESVVSPETEKRDVVKTWNEPLDGELSGVMYLYEQFNEDLYAELNVTVSGEERVLTAKLPAQIKRNAVYTLNLGGDGTSLRLSVNVDEWEYADETPVSPGFEDKITVDMERSVLPEGVTVEKNNTQLVFDYLPKDFIIALDCNDQLEVSNISRLPFEMTALGVSEGKNLFRVKKLLMPLGHEGMTGTVHFRRKGLNNTYQEDMLELVLNANPSAWYGDYGFELDTYACDFKDYFDGYIGYVVPVEGKVASLEFEEGEDRWMDMQNYGGMYTLMAGWKPNDPKADGREQKVKLVICDEETGANREEYQIIRLNYGLPVVEMNGVWWCKYNARGQSNSFEDQILVNDDPAAKAGMTVLEYLNTCSVEEYLDLWGWSYQDATGKGMRVIASDSIIKFDGYPSPQKTNINKLDRDALSPSGYELPSKAYFDRIFSASSMRVDVNGGPYTVKKAWNTKNNQVYVTTGNRQDLVVDGVSVPVTYHFEVYDQNNGVKEESVTFYGPGTQSNANGISHNNIVFGVYSTSTGWYNEYLSNGGGLKESIGTENNTRVLRFVKTPPMYMYE